MLTPLASLLIRAGVSYQSASECFKKAFVDAAENDFALHGKKISASRIATITSLNRKEVKRLRELDGTPGGSSLVNLNRSQRVINAWLNVEKFSSSRKEALALPFDGGTPSFSELVKVASGDMTPKVILDELQRLQCVEIDENGDIHLQNAGYIAIPGSEEQWQLAATSAADLLHTLENNLHFNKGEALLQRFVHYQHIPKTDVAEFNQLANEKSQNLLLELNQWLNDRAIDPQQVDGIEAQALGLGIYQTRRHHKDKP
jgi:hypothetical protein